ncbi:hypothetical protein KY290_007865 [Solanum tuberosum]|uniref:Uncharacterized protein n=1 Tax=Solanum tuberosum TaxID=4113 RepID=A0ABQ7W6Y3_SOLTU|nr:hypothetical protein KY290_007865 [Solanum tuberosum]
MSDTPSSNDGSPTGPCTPTTPSTLDVSIGSSSCSSTSGRLVISVVEEKFVPNGHSISKTITETFKERQDATGYSWKDISQSTRKFYWHEFLKSYQWNPTENSIMERTWNKAIELRRPPNSWDIFKKLHKRKDGNFVDAKSKCINIC